MSVERRGTKALELWARRATDGYQGVSISNMTTAWRNGLAFCALIHRFRPDLIEFSSLKPENILENNALAFRVAEQQLGIPALLDAEDMVDNVVPDRLSVLTYVSQYYRTFAAMGLTLPKRVVNNAAPQSTTTVKSKSTPPPQHKTMTELKTDKVLAGGRVRREVCAGCNNPVFLAERLLVGSPGQLMHRTCFRCARCDTQLTLASYYETEKGQFCCETCPDEEHEPSPQVVDATSTPSSKHKRRSSASDTDSDSDSNSEDSEEESDTYSHDAETLLEDQTHRTHTTLTHSPRPLKPRTVFLSQTLEAPDVKQDSNLDADDVKTSNRFSHFSQVSSALFGSRERESRVAATGYSNQHHCDEAKGMKTNPPETLTLDTGQHQTTPRISNGAIKTSSSIVAQRLKMFREISDNTVASDKKITNKIDGKSGTRQNYLLLDKKKETICVTKDEVQTDAVDPDKDQNSKDITSKVVYVDTVPSVNEENNDKIVDSLEKTDKTNDNSEKVDENVKDISPMPSIAITTEKQEVIPYEEPNREDDDTENFQFDSKTENSEELPPETDALEDCNPFEDEADSQQDESGVAVSQSEGSSETDNNNVTCVSQDSGGDFSSPSLQSIHYPQDLNPFGSDDEAQKEDATTHDAVKTEICEPRSDDNQKIARKLIKVNMNPFDSDDDDDEFGKELEKEKDEKKDSKNLNPFWSDDEDLADESVEDTPKKARVKPPRPPPPTLARNSNPSQMYPGSPDKIQLSPASLGGSATRKKIIAPPLSTSIRELFPPTSPPAQPHPSPSLSPPTLHPSPSSPSGSLALKRKGRRAPAPPQVATPKSGRASPTDSTADTLSMDTMSLSSIGTQSQEKQVQEEDQDEVLSWKMQKDMKNHSNKMNGTTDQRVPPPKPSRAFQASQNLTPVTGILRRPSMSKSEAGEWQRKKGPAPPRPVPQKRALKKLPMRIIQQELQDIEIKQTELERQGVLLETSIRSRTENTPNNSVEDATTPSSGPNSIEVEDMILQLFELVNEKNELFRRQTELMYLKREKRLEEEYVELEYQIRCLMLKPPSEKTETDTTQEEELIARLVKVVEQRDEIINCLELDRLREAQEDESIATHMMQYQEKHIDGIENGSSLQVSPKKKKTLKLPKKKKKKEKKDKKDTKADADKDIDETETTEVKKKKKKKKWLF